MQNAQVSNPKDFQVVSFHNLEDFGFTPEMGCMFDGRAIHGAKGSPGIEAGESMTLPYHIAHRLATNLAKVALTRKAPSVDPAGIPTGVPLWDVKRLETLKSSYLTDLYSEAKPTALSEVDKLMAKVEELNRWKEGMEKKAESVKEEKTEEVKTSDSPKIYQDKAEVIAELTKRGIKFDARQTKANLEKLLA